MTRNNESCTVVTGGPLDPPTASPKLPKSLDADTSNCRGWLTGENAIGVGPGQVQ